MQFCAQNSPLLGRVVRQLNLIHTLIYCLSRIHVDIVLSFVSRFSKYSHSLKFSDKNFVCIFHVLLSLALNYVSNYGLNNMNFIQNHRRFRIFSMAVPDYDLYYTLLTYSDAYQTSIQRCR
jgi:hypothetical protein